MWLWMRVRQWMDACCCCCNAREGDIISSTKGLTMLLLHFIMPHMILFSRNYKEFMWFNDPTTLYVVCAVNNCSIITEIDDWNVAKNFLLLKLQLNVEQQSKLPNNLQQHFCKILFTLLGFITSQWNPHAFR